MTEFAPLTGHARPTIITADLGGTHTSIVEATHLVKHADNPDIEIPRYDTPTTYDEAIHQIGMRTAALLGGRRLDGFGFGVAGQVTDGTITKAGQLTTYGWMGRHVARDIAAELGVEEFRVVGLNDVEAAATAEQTARQMVMDQAEAIFTISTGFGGAVFTREKIIPDEPGHHHLEYGVTCGCGKNGCIEAHISGSGIENKYGQRAETIPDDDSRWVLIKQDMVAALDSTLTRYQLEGLTLGRLSFYGSVALKGPGIIEAIRNGMQDTFIEAPIVDRATFGENSGLFGAYFAVNEALQ